MKNILNYYYKIIIDDSMITDNGYFSYNNHLFYLCEYKRNNNEIEALYYLNELMISQDIKINKIIKNIFNQIITYHDNQNYCLIMIGYDYIVNAIIKFIPAIINPKLDVLKRNNWGKLWSIKIDYIEYQLLHLGNKYPIINSSVNYYIGLAENAIAYFNMLDLSNVPLYINHRRINNSNIYNPLELVLDYKARDIAEDIKLKFFHKEMTIIEIQDYLTNLNLDNIDYVLIYNRMLYPSYYFDIYEKVMNDNVDEKEIIKITDLSSSYEELLYEVYRLCKGKINIIGIDWINNKFM